VKESRQWSASRRGFEGLSRSRRGTPENARHSPPRLVSLAAPTATFPASASSGCLGRGGRVHRSGYCRSSRSVVPRRPGSPGRRAARYGPGSTSVAAWRREPLTPTRLRKNEPWPTLPRITGGSHRHGPGQRPTGVAVDVLESTKRSPQGFGIPHAATFPECGLGPGGCSREVRSIRKCMDLAAKGYLPSENA